MPVMAVERRGDLEGGEGSKKGAGACFSCSFAEETVWEGGGDPEFSAAPGIY